MEELKILSASMMDRGCFSLVDKYIENKELTPEGQKLLGVIRDFYTRDPSAQSCDREIVTELAVQSIPDHMQKPREAIRMTIERIPPEVSVENLSSYILAVKREQIESDLHAALLSRAEPKKISDLMDKWREIENDNLELEEEDTEIYTGWDIEDLVKDHFLPSNLIRILPTKLNEKFDGGAKPSHHILIYAPTEMGKSAFCINMTYGFLRQNLRVLYIGNEDPVADLDMRLVNRITGMKKSEVREDPKKAKELASKVPYATNFTIAGLGPGNFLQIKELTAEYDPHVVILDQLGNLDMKVGNDSPTLQLMNAAKAARALGKTEHRLMVSVAQASDDAYGRLNLRKNDVQWSNVDLPGQLDLMLGIGGTEEMEAGGSRRISIPKNKLSGDHEPLDVELVKDYSLIRMYKEKSE